MSINGGRAAITVTAIEGGKIKINTLQGEVEINLPPGTQPGTSITLEGNALEILELISTNRATFDYKNPLLFQKLD